MAHNGDGLAPVVDYFGPDREETVIRVAVAEN